MTQPRPMTVKAFWDAVEQYLEGGSAEDLRHILREMARNTPSEDRHRFVEQLQRPQQQRDPAPELRRQEDLLEAIEDFLLELQAEMEHPDRQSSWDEWNDEDSLGPYVDFIEPLTDLFHRTRGAFEAGELALARHAYLKLFETFQEEDDYGRGIRGNDLDQTFFHEARAQYLRTVYETTLAAQRPAELFTELQRLGYPRLMLEDLRQISPKPLPDWDSFLCNWIDFLHEQEGRNADAWLREAVGLARGTQGLAELARQEGKQRPLAFLDWIAALHRENNHREVLAVAREALQALPQQLPLRAAIADYLCQAALQLNDLQAIQSGKWEAFLARPTLLRLLDLWDSLPAGSERTALMRRAAAHVQDYLAHPPPPAEMFHADRIESPAWISNSVLVHAYFLAQQWEEAQQPAVQANVLGWSGSDNPQAVVVPVFLAFLSGRSPDTLPPNLGQLWNWCLAKDQVFATLQPGDANGVPLPHRLTVAYRDLFGGMTLSEDRQERWLSWCIDAAKRRAIAIVGGQHRRSYDMAALVIAAAAEVLRLRNRREEEQALIRELREQFRRHSAFQAELKKAIARKDTGNT